MVPGLWQGMVAGAALVGLPRVRPGGRRSASRDGGWRGMIGYRKVAHQRVAACQKHTLGLAHHDAGDAGGEEGPEEEHHRSQARNKSDGRPKRQRLGGPHRAGQHLVDVHV